ncbi:hypothetical protein BC827DRAFT_1180510 [Russula dissimulans]|nr:hypothetical protein BC827DRAFT_1180510 [Russula dissimulans]
MRSSAIISTLSLALVIASATPTDVQQQSWSAPTTNDVRVPVTLGVMSRCPDALKCEALFDSIIPRVREKINLSLAYVAKFNVSDPQFGVSCMHGPGECAGNVQQLCVQKHTTSIQAWWEFVMCQNYQGRDEIGKPEVASRCARIAGIDWEMSGAGRCAGLDGSGKGYEGLQLLHDSIRLVESLGITKSCTIIINTEKVCVLDGSWKECENGHEVKDFVKQIEAAYDELNGLSSGASN